MDSTSLSSSHVDFSLTPKKRGREESDIGGKAKSATPFIKEEEERNSHTVRSSTSSRRVYPIVTLNPYQNSWVIKVRVTNKGPLRTFNSQKGSGNVFTVEFTDEKGTEIQATMWRDAADKFYPIFQLGKVYYVSKGTLKPANKQYASVKNDYEMILNANAQVEEVEDNSIPSIQYNFVKLDSMGSYVNGKSNIDVIGIVQNVASIMTVRRKSDGEEVPKRDITIADESNKTVVVTLWDKFATEDGEKLMEMQTENPIVALKSVRVGDYQGVNLNTSGRTMLSIDPDLPEKTALQTWYKSEGKNANFSAAGAGLARNGPGNFSIYENRKALKSISPTEGEDKPSFFNARLVISSIKPDQPMFYQACEKCNRKVISSDGSSQYWCEGCGQNYDTCRKRYIMAMKVIDSSGEVYVSTFNDQGEAILGITADQLSELKEEDHEQRKYKAVLKNASWTHFNMRLSVEMSEYNNEKRQRIKLRSLSAVDWVGESNYLLEQIAKLKLGRT